MQLPAPKHPLAVLRRITGLGQKKLAELAQCATPTIQAVELLKLKLSDKLADRVAFETGVSPAWLLAGDPKAIAVTDTGEPFTKDYFEKTRASIENPPVFGDKVDPVVYGLIGFVLQDLIPALRKASEAGRMPMLQWKLAKFLKEIAAEFNPAVNESIPAETILQAWDNLPILGRAISVFFNFFTKPDSPDDAMTIVADAGGDFGAVIEDLSTLAGHSFELLSKTSDDRAAEAVAFSVQGTLHAISTIAEMVEKKFKIKLPRVGDEPTDPAFPHDVTPRRRKKAAQKKASTRSKAAAQSPAAG